MLSEVASRSESGAQKKLDEPPPIPPDMWDALPHLVKDRILWLEQRLRQAEERILALEAQVQVLMEKLGRSSSNSSKPPSSDRPDQRKVKKKKRGRRRPGGQ